MCSISWKRFRNTWKIRIVLFWKIFCPGQKNFLQGFAKLKYRWLQSSRLKISRYSLFCVYLLFSELITKSSLLQFNYLYYNINPPNQDYLVNKFLYIDNRRRSSSLYNRRYCRIIKRIRK